jgi:hypothetical protein
MIDKSSYTKEWVASFRNNPDYSKTDPALIEKMIMALALLEQLALHKLNFVFKGGTSLILMLERANRFSIDIDISTEHTGEELETVFNSLVQSSIFLRFEPDLKRSFTGKFSKAHYKFYYTSNFSTSRTNVAANYVLLDIVFEKAEYPTLGQVEIKTGWLKTKEPYHRIVTPTLNAILGDKLTAYAPNTTGVPFNRKKETEIIKQLFDVAFLAGEISDMKEVSESFFTTARKEIGYRSLEIDPDAVLDDIFQTGIMITRREKNTGEDTEKFEEIKKGIRGLRNMVISNFFTIEQAIEASAKAAWLAMKLKNGNFSAMEMYNSEIDLSGLHIENRDYQFINKLKKSNKPAFYYWHQCLNETGQLT